MKNQETYRLYKGLQRPLVFRIFKGKYIYWGVGSIVAGIVCGGVVGATISSFAGVATLLAVGLPLLSYTIKKQKQGLFDKKRDNNIYIIAPKYFHGKKTHF